MKTLTDAELAELKELEVKLHEAVPHSGNAIALGHRIGTIYRQAHIRNNPPNPMIDRAMNRLARRLGIK